MKDSILEILMRFEVNEDAINEISNLDFSEYKTKEEVDEIIKNSLLDTAILSELEKEKAKSIKVLKSLLDISKITYEDGEFKGIKEQILEIKKEAPYLFLEETIYTPKNGEGVKNLEKMSDKDYFNYIKTNGGY